MRPGFITNSANASIALALYLWAARNELNTVQRQGFGNLFYVALLGHIESLLSGYLRARIHAAGSLIPWTELPAEKTFSENRVNRQYPTGPLIDSLKSMILGYDADLENATINKLTELYKKIVGSPLNEAISEQTHKHIKALSQLRNVFAHGRTFFLDMPNPISGTATLKNTPLQFPVQVLIDVGIVDNLNYDGLSYSKFADAFYSDDGMRCFWDAAREVDAALRSCDQLNILTRALLPEALPNLES